MDKKKNDKTVEYERQRFNSETKEWNEKLDGRGKDK
jgi:hypothetical protein